MANLHLVTGYAGTEHVRSADEGALNAAMIGNIQAVLGKGNQLSASAISNNTVRVLDGDIIMQGRHIRLNENTYVDLTIENGEQGLKRNDLIVARYTKNSLTAVEEVNLVVIKGTAAENEPSDPAYTVGDILNNGDLLNDMPLYRVPLNGINLGEPVQLFTLFNATLEDVKAVRESILTKADRLLSNLTNYQKALYNIGGRPRKNLLRNPRFKINQLGQITYTWEGGGIYGIDGFRSSGGAGSLTVTSYGISLTGNILEKISDIPYGVPITVSALKNDGTLVENTGTLTGEASAITVSGVISLAYYDNAWSFFLYTNDFVAVKLEIGNTQTLAYQDENGVWQLFDDYDYNEDLMNCTANHYKLYGEFLGTDFVKSVGAVPMPPDGEFKIYVSVDGSDTTGDGTQENPFATLQKAVDSIPVVNSNNVYSIRIIKAGTYVGFAVRNKKFNLYNNSGNEVIITSVTHPDYANQHCCMYLEKCNVYFNGNLTLDAGEENASGYGIFAIQSNVNVSSYSSGTTFTFKNCLTAGIQAINSQMCITRARVSSNVGVTIDCRFGSIVSVENELGVGTSYAAIALGGLLMIAPSGISADKLSVSYGGIINNRGTLIH